MEIGILVLTVLSYPSLFPLSLLHTEYNRLEWLKVTKSNRFIDFEVMRGQVERTPSPLSGQTISNMISLYLPTLHSVSCSRGTHKIEVLFSIFEYRYIDMLKTQNGIIDEHGSRILLYYIYYIYIQYQCGF